MKGFMKLGCFVALLASGVASAENSTNRSVEVKFSVIPVQPENISCEVVQQPVFNFGYIHGIKDNENTDTAIDTNLVINCNKPNVDLEITFLKMPTAQGVYAFHRNVGNGESFGFLMEIDKTQFSDGALLGVAGDGDRSVSINGVKTYDGFYYAGGIQNSVRTIKIRTKTKTTTINLSGDIVFETDITNSIPMQVVRIPLSIKATYEKA